MPVADPTSGRIFIWVISCFLFSCIAVGGSFLILYITLPQNISRPWLPIAGVTLVCLPWTFWFFTCVYRIISRALGIRVVFGSGAAEVGGGGGGAQNVVSGDRRNLESTLEIGEEGEGRRTVQFAGEVVMRENDNGSNEKKKSNMGKLSTSLSGRDLSFASHESETPLTLST